MTFSLYQFTDVHEGSGDPIYPPQIRLTAQALSNTYVQLGYDGSNKYYAIRGIIVSNDDGSTGIRIRIATAGSGQDAGQSDQYIGPNSTGYVLIHRKDISQTGNKLWITAVADT